MCMAATIHPVHSGIDEEGMMNTMKRFWLVLIIAFVTPRLDADSLFTRYVDSYLQQMDGASVTDHGTAGKWSLKMSVSPVGAEGRDEAAKFTEYRDVPNGAWSNFQAEYLSDSHAFLGIAKNVGL